VTVSGAARPAEEGADSVMVGAYKSPSRSGPYTYVPPDCRLRNASDDIHPLHLHRHTFEVTNFAGTATHGLHKDVVMLGGYQSLDLDFTADQPGLSLFHCHQQLHMDYGFMILLRCS
jgi:hypothetical protein